MIGDVKHSSYGYARGEHFVMEIDRPLDATVFGVFVVVSRSRLYKHRSVCVAAFASRLAARRWCVQRNEKPQRVVTS